jgi:GNAT superfamily N-acetyltransferase
MRQSGAVEFTITPLAETDADELGRVHVAIWREAYAGIVPDDHLASLDPAARAERWRQISRQPGDALNVVARDERGDLVGFASAGPCRDDDLPTDEELWAVYVLARTRGSGLADALVDRVLDDRDACLWVFEANDRARAFYAHHGFVADGTRSTYGTGDVPEIRMVRRRNRPPGPRV